MCVGPSDQKQVLLSLEIPAGCSSFMLADNELLLEFERYRECVNRDFSFKAQIADSRYATPSL
ncbi:hypothetical protein GN244_ATG18256 [Phytophthora infestans]|uniref:Uncharacterized protein n=1 Tax=Phytophthora infestans TaxID=4787 RepID=A0A833WK98_PHYIN|nr:hypothetical protein GN244_ATG18256 [Phytophthora infestans]